MTAPAPTVRVWDPVIRLFHWTLVAAFATAFLAEEGGRLHDAAGYVVLGLIGLRLIWGIVGPVHARFADFVPMPAQLVCYLRSVVQGRSVRFLRLNSAGGSMYVM